MSGPRASQGVAAGLPAARLWTRELATNRPLRIYEALSAPGKCRARFAPHRWESFTHDVAFFRRHEPGNEQEDGPSR